MLDVSFYFILVNHKLYDFSSDNIFCSSILVAIDSFHVSLMQVSLSNVKGTGPDGVIVKADVEEFIGIHCYMSILIDV